MVVILWLLPHCLPLQCHYGLSRDCTFASTGWSRGMPIRKYCEAGEGPESRAHSINSYLQDCEVFYPISKFTRRICLKLCMWLYLKNLRIFFCWRFSRKIHFVGFFCVFLVFFIFFHLWLINDRIKGHFHHEGKPVAAKSTFMKIINGQRSFERSEKISPRGKPKCRKVPKLFFWLNHFDQIDDLSSRNGPHGLGQ